MAERVLREGGICTDADFPVICQRKYTAAQRTARQTGNDGREAGLGVQVMSWAGRRLEDVGGR